MNKANHINFFERFFYQLVIICIALGIILGKILPIAFINTLSNLEISQVNIPISILIWIMIIPILLRVDLKEIQQVRKFWRGSLITFGVNWLVKPFTMAFLGWLFLKHLFSSWLPPDQIDHYFSGLILLATAPGTAMVFIWSYLSDGEPHFTLTQVAFNDFIMIFAFAPIARFLLGMNGFTVPWNTLLISLTAYILVPFFIAQVFRYWFTKKKHRDIKPVLKKIHPISISALLLMLVLLFGFQGHQIYQSPVIVLLIAVPIIIQIYFNSFLAYGLNKMIGEQHCIAAPSALIGGSNFFELAIATAITLFGVRSGAALAIVVGILIEVPVMLSIVTIVNNSKNWYEKNI